jgi:hypothetical protein
MIIAYFVNWVQVRNRKLPAAVSFEQSHIMRYILVRMCIYLIKDSGRRRPHQRMFETGKRGTNHNNNILQQGYRIRRDN